MWQTQNAIMYDKNACTSNRQLVLDIVRAGSQATPVPIFVKIRLLDTIEETIKLCHQLRDAGASLIAIHGRCKCCFPLFQ